MKRFNVTIELGKKIQKKGVPNTMITQNYVKNQVSQLKFIMNIIDIIIEEPEYVFGRRKVYSEIGIIKLLVILKIKRISYRLCERFMESHKELFEMTELAEMPGKSVISYRANHMDFHEINNRIIKWLFEHIRFLKLNCSIDGNLMKPCKETRVGKAKSTFVSSEFGYAYTTKGVEFGKLLVMACDLYNDFILDFKTIKGSVYESTLFDYFKSTIYGYRKVLLDAAYDTYEICSDIMKSGSIPVIDINCRNTKKSLSYNRYVMHIFRYSVFKNNYRNR